MRHSFLYFAALAFPWLCACQSSDSKKTAINPVKSGEIVLEGRHYGPEEIDKTIAPRRPGATPRPAYPPELVNAKIEGGINMLLAIDEKGNVTEVHTVNATDIRFAESAKKTMMTWRMPIGIRHGKPVKTWRVIPLYFKLS
jgi:TonB family protein